MTDDTLRIVHDAKRFLPIAGMVSAALRCQEVNVRDRRFSVFNDVKFAPAQIHFALMR
jgi:hypothetical protein